MNLQRILDSYWEEIARLAYEGYRSSGKGAVYIDKTGHGTGISDEKIRIGYAVYDYKSDKPDPDVARLIKEYDPDWEVIFQYMRTDGSVHTLRLRTAPGARQPLRIFLFDKMMKEDGWQDDE